VPDEIPEAVRAMLESVVRRDLAEGRIEGDPALLAQGWERRFVADAARVEELTRLYEDLGYQVLCMPIRPEQIGGSCAGCRAVILAQFHLIYTHRPDGGGSTPSP
jgi:hypothetical protein